jgi:hypothetical protein
LSKGQGFKRSVSLVQFNYNPDGSIPLITPTKDGITKSVSFLDPYTRVQAETMAWSEGLKTAKDKNTGVYVTKINSGDYLKVRSVDFSKGAKKIEVSVASASTGGILEIRLDNPDGKLLGSFTIDNTGGWQNWKTVMGKVKKTTGVHNLCFVFKGGDGELFNFDWWRFLN